MELLNNILVALTTENEALIKFLSVPLLLIEQTLNMFLFLTVLNINSTKQNRIIYLFIQICLGSLAITIWRMYLLIFRL